MNRACPPCRWVGVVGGGALTGSHGAAGGPVGPLARRHAHRRPRHHPRVRLTSDEQVCVRAHVR
eukprot:2864656-Pyramimonas_sp.AAC.1